MGQQSSPRVERGENFHKISFSAMASPCELLVEAVDTVNDLALSALSKSVYSEVQRIENKFSRYRRDNLCSAINNAKGKKIAIDDECFRLFEFASECFLASEGLFDITSGVLRKAWVFDGSSRIPEQKIIDDLLTLIGWQKVTYSADCLQMPAGMEIDFGGIGKEYAVNRAAQLCMEFDKKLSVVVNFGGDIQITRPRANGQAWFIGIENPDKENTSQGVLKIVSGALATSGDARRFLLHEGKRYSHILNPKTGWPIVGAPRSVTVAAPQCIQAGCLATMALLQGESAEEFLKAQNINYWCVWK